jgi:hypothetical protein
MLNYSAPPFLPSADFYLEIFHSINPPSVRVKKTEDWVIDRVGPFCYHLIKSDNIGGINGQNTDTTDRGPSQGA